MIKELKNGYDGVRYGRALGHDGVDSKVKTTRRWSDELVIWKLAGASTVAKGSWESAMSLWGFLQRGRYASVGR